MKVIKERNVQDCLARTMRIVESEGKLRDSRNGPVHTFETPVTAVYQQPRERVVFIPERDCNPFFHFMESLWMMAGRNDVEFVSQFASNIANYSDNGVTFHGAYGYRWRNAEALEQDQDTGQYEVNSFDQLATIAELLKKNPEDRRIVLQMWNADMDLGKEGKDFPCNLMATFRINPTGHLDMTVFNRSNDIIWGAYGANAVHFSFLQEVMASWIGVPVGRYWQISTNFHAYVDTYNKHKDIRNTTPGFSPYETGEVEPYPIVNGSIEDWFADLQMFMEQGPVMGFKDKFFKKVAVPMLQSWNAWKDRENPNYKEIAIQYANRIEASDWRKACIEWLERRA